MRDAAIEYAVEKNLSVEELIDVLERSTLAQRRPVTDAARIAQMLTHANLVVTARADGLLVGVARSLTDFSYCCYLSDLAVDSTWQRRGIGKELVHRTRDAASKQATLVLLAAPGADDYYAKIGMTRASNCWTILRE